MDLETSSITGCGNAQQLLTQIAGEVTDDATGETMLDDPSVGESSDATSSDEMPGGMEGGASESPSEVSEIEQRRIDALNDRDAAIASIVGSVSITGTPPDEVEATERESLKGDIETAISRLRSRAARQSLTALASRC